MYEQSSKTSLAVAVVDGLSTQDMWEMYVQGIIAATGLPGSNLILTGTTVVANLATTSVAVPPDPTVPQALAQIYDLGDNLLLPQGFFTQAGQSFFGDYATYIDALEPKNANPTPSEKAAILSAQASLAAANSQFGKDLISASSAYFQEGALLPGKWANFQDFLNTTPWGGVLNNDQNEVNGLNSQLSTLYTQVYGQDYVAINNAKTVVDKVRSELTASAPSSPAEMLISTDAGNRVVPTYNPGSLATFSSWVDAAATGPANNQPPAVSFNISQGAGQYDFSQSTYFSRTSWSEDFFFFSISGTKTTQKNKVNVDTSSASFNVNVTFQALTTVTIDPGPWYDSSLMYNYPNSSGLVRPISLIIGMMPTVKVSFDAASYQSAYSSYLSSSSFGVGIFGIAGGGDGSQSTSSSFHSHWDTTALTLTISDESTQPKIIGLQVLEPSA